MPHDTNLLTGPRFGQFPEPLTPLANTLTMDLAISAVGKARDTGLMAALHGPSGSGKTAAAVHACEQVGGDWVYVQAPYRGGVKDVIAAWYTAVVGRTLTGTARRASDELVHALWERQVGLVIDETHYAGTVGIQAIRYVHDQTAATYRYRFPIVLIGAELDAVLASSGGEMTRRAPWRVAFQPLNEHDLANVLPTMHPRFEGIDPRLVTVVNKRYAHGLPGRWANFALAADTTPGNEPFSRADVADALLYLGVTV